MKIFIAMEELITIEAFAHIAVDQKKLQMRFIEQELATLQQENVPAFLSNRNVLNLF